MQKETNEEDLFRHAATALQDTLRRDSHTTIPFSRNLDILGSVIV